MNVVVADTETTGIGPRARIVEVGYILLPEAVEVEFSLPFDRHEVEAGAARVNGLGPSGRMTARRLPSQDAARMLVEDWRDRLVVMNNPAFDIHYIRQWIEAEGFQPSWRYHPADVKMLLAGLLGEPPNVAGDRLQAEFGYAPEPEVHSALEGARLVRRQWDAYESRRRARVMPAPNHKATWRLPPFGDPARTPELEAQWRRDYNTCATCDSTALHVENYSSMWHDGDMVCENGHYVRAYDAG